MRSYILFTEEIDDPEEAAEQLKEQYEELTESETLPENQAALIMVSYETDMEELAPLLKDALPFPFIFVSALGIFDRERGYYADGITVILMADDSTRFAAGITGDLSQLDMRTEFERVYRDALDTLGATPALALMYADVPGGTTGDEYVREFSDIAGIPVYGGAAADLFQFTDTFVGCNEQTAPHGCAFLFISEVKRFAQVELSVKPSDRIKTLVTKADRNVVMELDGRPALDVLDEMKVTDGKSDGAVMLGYTALPFLFSSESGGIHYSALRNLSAVNRADGSIQFLGEIPEGSQITLSRINQESIHESLNAAEDRMTEWLAGEGKESHLILCTSCVARYLNLNADRCDEVNILRDRLPEGINLAGFYSFGEFGPMTEAGTEGFVNVFHNSTLTMLVL